MHHLHFGLHQAPFKITPDTEFFYSGGNRGAILDALMYAVTHGEGMVKVSGEVGSGKTMLCRMLAARLPPEIETVYLAHPSVSPQEVLHAIALEMGLAVPREASRLELTHALQQHLLTCHDQGKRVVLLVEEAQGMPLDTLEEVRLLSNLETEREKLLQIVLFGQPELDEHLARPDMRQLKERITHSFALAPLAPGEIRDYLGFRLRAAGYRGPDLFSGPVVRHIARYSRGLTRRVNIIADKAMLAAFSAGTHDISPNHIHAAAKDSEYQAQGGWPTRRGAAAGLALLAALGGLGMAMRAANPPRARGQAVPRPAVAAPAAAARTVPVDKLPAADANSADLLEARLAATARWLAREKPRTFTIQLLGTNNRTQLEGYLASLDPLIGLDRVFVYRTVAGGRPWLAVLYGRFSGRAEAQRALAQLPARLKSQHPYLRSVQGIRAETGSAA